MTVMASQIISLKILLFTQPFIQVQIKENIKAPRHWLLWEEFTCDKWIPCANGRNVENVSIRWRHKKIRICIYNIVV